MLDRSSKLDDSLMDAYRSIHEVHKGHAAGESDIEKQASQLASDIRYKAKGRIRDGMNSEDKKRIYLKLLASSPAPGIVKSKAKRKLLGESVLINEIMPAGDTATERTKNVKRVVRGVGRVAKGVVGIAKRKGTLSQKITGAAIDAAKPAVNKVSDWSKSPTASKSETASSYKTRSAKKKVDLSKPGDKSGPTIDLKRKKGTTNTYEGLSNWRKDLLGEEGYDHWRDKHLERGGIGAVASKSPSRPYTRSEKQPKGKTVYQKQAEKEHGKGVTALDIVKKNIEKEHGKGAIMKNEETSAADKIINSIRSQRVDEGKLVHGPFGPYITGQKMPKEQREVPLRKVPYEDINSAKKVVEDAKMGRQSDEKLASLQKQFSGMDQSTPSNQHMLKRVNREINKRKKQNSVEEEVTNEAKVDKVKHGDNNLYDNPGKEKDRNERKFGKQSFNQKGQTQLRRGLHWSKRGDKKVKGAKVEEEVGVSSSAAMIKARQEAELKSKEEAAVKKAKKAKNEEVALENRMASHTAGMSDAQKDSASNTISKGAAYKMGRRSDAAAFKDRKQSGKRGNPQQYRKSADSPEWEGRFPYGKSNIRQGKGSIKDLKNEYSPAVEKVIESIKINKASPKSPNCIIMPKKDDISDKAGGNGKKSTKNVVSKKQKQFFNQEGKTYTLKEFKEVAKSVIVKTGGALGKKVKPGDIAKVAPKTTAITKVAPSAIEKVKPKTSTLAKSGVKQTAIQTATQTAVDKVGNKKPPTTGEKGGALTKPEPQKQGNQSKGIDLKMPKNIKANLKTLENIKNPQ